MEEYDQTNNAFAVHYAKVSGGESTNDKDLFTAGTLRPTTQEGFFVAGAPSVQLSRMRFFAVYNDPEKKQCESVVERQVLWTGVFKIQDLKKQGNKNLINMGVDISVQEYEVNDNGKLDCVKKAPIISRMSDASRRECSEPEKIIRNRKTLDSGDLQFYYKLSHKLYNTQKFYIRKFIFEVEGYRPVERMFAFVPWEYGFLTYQNITTDWLAQQNNPNASASSLYVSLKNIVDTNKILNPPALRLDQYGTMLIEPSYTIKDSLDINTVKNLMVVLRPTIARFDNQGRTIRVAPLALPRGYYIVRMILVKGPQERKEGRLNIVSSDMSMDPLRRLKSFFTGSVYSQAYDQYVSLFRNYEDSGSFSDSKYADFKGELENQIDQVKSNLAGLVNNFKENIYINALNFNRAGDCLESNYNPNCGQPYEVEDYISHYDTLAYSENGSINAFINLEFSTEKFRHLGSRNGVIIQIYPTDPGEYEYLKDSKGNKTCQIDIQNTTWKPYTDHDLVNKPHLGLSSFSGQGAFNRVHPMDERLLENLVQSAGNPNAPMKSLEEEFSETVNINIRKALKDVQTELRSTVKDESLLEFVDMDRLPESQDEFDEYCSETSISRGAEKHLRPCICLKNFGSKDQWNSDLNYRTKLPGENTISACVQLAEKMYRLDKIQSRFQQFTPFQKAQEDNKQHYCEMGRSSSYGYDGERSDISNEGVSFKKCVCESSQESLTLAMAQCFAKNQGVQVIDITKDDRFLTALNKVDEFVQYNTEIDQQITRPVLDVLATAWSWFGGDEDNNRREEQRSDEKSDHLEYMNYTQVMGSDALASYKLGHLSSVSPLGQEDLSHLIKEGVNHNNRHQPLERSFLHLMCYFWFDQYYEDFFNVGQISSMYDFQKEYASILGGQAMNAPGVSQSSSLQFRFGQSDQLKQSPFVEASVGWDININKSLLLPGQGAFSMLLIGGLNSGKLPNQHPYYRCLKNPLYFFHLERKVMVGKLSDRPEDMDYKSGHVYSFITNEVTSADMREGWGMRSQFSVGSEVKLSLGSILGVGTRASSEKSISDTHDRSQRESESSVSSVTLAVNQLNVQLGFEQYRQCLLIRPKRTAFDGYGDNIWNSRFKQNVQTVIAGGFQKEKEEFIQFAYKYFGLLLCDEEVNSPNEVLHVDESYFYIHQFFAGHYEFMSRTIYHNRPFVQIIRGKHSMDKFEVLTRGESYKLWDGKKPQHLNLKQTLVDHNLIKAFQETRLDWAGFMEGIYTYTNPNDHYLYNVDRQDILETKNWFDKAVESGLNWLDDVFNWSDERKVPRVD